MRWLLLASESLLDRELLGRSLSIKHVPLYEGRAQHMGKLCILRLTKSGDLVSYLWQARPGKQSASSWARDLGKIRPMVEGDFRAFRHNVFNRVKGSTEGAHGRYGSLPLMAGLTFST
eukprot:312466-Amphidinium_carterae.1